MNPPHSKHTVSTILEHNPNTSNTVNVLGSKVLVSQATAGCEHLTVTERSTRPL